MQFSAVTCERLAASELTLSQLRVRIEAIKGEHSEAKAALAERQESMLELIHAVSEEHAGEQWPEAETKKITAAQVDFQRAESIFADVDRRKRSMTDQERRQIEHIVKIVADAREGQDLFSQGDAKKSRPEAVGLVLLEDIAGIGAGPFTEIGIHSVADFVDAWKSGALKDHCRRGGILKAEHVAPIADAVKAWMESRGMGDKIPSDGPFFDKREKRKADADALTLTKKKQSSKKKSGRKPTPAQAAADAGRDEEETPLAEAKGFPKRAIKPLGAMDIETVEDLLNYTVDDQCQIEGVEGLGKATITALYAWMAMDPRFSSLMDPDDAKPLASIAGGKIAGGNKAASGS